MAFLPALGAAALAGGGAAAAGATAATALTAAGTIFAGISQYQQARYQAQIAKNNYHMQLQNAQSESERSQEAQRRSDIEYAQLYAQQEALQGASGLDTLGATQLATRDLTDRTGRLAAQDIRREGEANIQGFYGQANQARLEGKAANASAQAALIGMTLGLGGSVAKDPGLRKSLVSASRSVRRSLY